MEQTLWREIGLGYEPSDEHDESEEELQLDVGPDDLDAADHVAAEVFERELVVATRLTRSGGDEHLADVLELEEPVAADNGGHVDEEGGREPAGWLATFEYGRHNARLGDEQDGAEQRYEIDQVLLDAIQNENGQEDVTEAEESRQDGPE